MTPCLRLLALIACAIAATCTVGGCPLPGYPDGEITCDPNNRDAPCPDGFACLDVQKNNRTVCVEIGCGDGNVSASAKQIEQCDDANRNQLDMCGARCTAARFVPEVRVGYGPGDALPRSVALGQPTAVAADRQGNVFVGSFGSNLIARYDAAEQKVTTFAGSGSIVNLGNGRAAPPNEIATPISGGLAVDGQGNLFIADLFENVIRRVDAVTGLSTVVVPTRAASDEVGTEVQDTPSTGRPGAIAVDGDGTLFFVDQDFDEGSPVRRIRRVDPGTGTMTTIHAGVRAATSAGTALGGIGDVDFDDNGTLYTLASTAIVVLAPGKIDGEHQDDGVPVRLRAPCAPVEGIQQKLAVAPDGETAYYAAKAKVYRVELTRSDGTITATCDQLAELPTAQVATLPIVNAFSEPGPIDLSYSGNAALGDALLAADPSGGVVWRIPVDQSSDFVPLIGQSSSDEDGTFANDLIVELALQTDGRMTASETRDCSSLLPPDASRLDRRNLELFAAFPNQHRLVTVTCADQISVVAGNGTRGSSDGGGDPLRAQLNNPVAAVRALDGNIYIADRDNDAIRKIERVVDVTGTRQRISTFIADQALDGLPLRRPSGITADDSGRLLISDAGNGRIVRVDPGTLEVEVLLSDLLEPSSLVFLPYAYSEELLALAPACAERPTVEPCGLLVLAERSGHRVRAVALEPLLGVQFDLAGGPSDEEPTPGDRDAVTVDGKVRSELRFPRGLMLDVPGLVVDGTGAEAIQPNLLIIDSVARARRLSIGTLQVLPPSLTTSLATVTPLDQDGVGLPSSDDALDGGGFLRGPVGLAALDGRRLLVLERITGRLRLVTLGAPTTIVTVSGVADGLPADVGAPVPAAQAVPLLTPGSIVLDVLDDGGQVLYASEPSLGRVRRFQLVDVDDPSTWTTDVLPLSPDAAREPAGLAIDPQAGQLYIADRAEHVVVRVDRAGGTSTLIAGRPGQRGSSGDADLATGALLNAPEQVLVVEQAGRHLLYIADAGNQRVRRVDLQNGLITTVLGDGSAGSGGEGAPASSFPVFSPRGMAVDRAGNLFVTSGNAIRMVQADTAFSENSEAGVADGNDAVATVYGKPPRSTFPEPVTRCLADVILSPSSSTRETKLLAIDSCLGVLIELERKE